MIYHAKPDFVYIVTVLCTRVLNPTIIHCSHIKKNIFGKG